MTKLHRVYRWDVFLRHSVVSKFDMTQSITLYWADECCEEWILSGCVECSIKCPAQWNAFVFLGGWAWLDCKVFCTIFVHVLFSRTIDIFLYFCRILCSSLLSYIKQISALYYKVNFRITVFVDCGNCRLWRQAPFRVLWMWFLILTRQLCVMITSYRSYMLPVNRLYSMVMTHGSGCFQRCLRDLTEQHRFSLRIILRFAASVLA